MFTYILLKINDCLTVLKTSLLVPKNLFLLLWENCLLLPIIFLRDYVLPNIVETLHKQNKYVAGNR